VAVQAELGIVGKIGAELQEKRAEVLVHAVKIVMIDQSRGLHDPGIASIFPRVVSLLSAIDRAFLLCFADENDTFPVSIPTERFWRNGRKN